MACNSFTAQLPCPLAFPLGVVDLEPTETDYSIEAGLFQFLTEHPQVGCIVNGNVFPYYVHRHVEQSQYPCITYEISEAPVESVTGQSGLHTITLDLVCWATTLSTAQTLGNKVRQSLQAYRGWFGNVAVAGSWYQGYDDDAEDPKDNSSVYWFNRTVTFHVTYLVPLHTF